MTSRNTPSLLTAIVLCGGLVAAANPPRSAAACAPDAVEVGPLCVDRYEASVWRLAPSSATLIAALRAGTATAADLPADARRGEMSDDYDPGCPDNGDHCVKFYAASIPGVKPSRFLTWFQAAAACRNADKRLLSSAEWQMAALGTPDPGTDNQTTDCNITDGDGKDPTNTGARSLCVANSGAADMVGNLWEWVANWDEKADAVQEHWINGDLTLVGSAGSAASTPAAVTRGGSSSNGTSAGVYAYAAYQIPTFTTSNLGFRCAR